MKLSLRTFLSSDLADGVRLVHVRPAQADPLQMARFANGEALRQI